MYENYFVMSRLVQSMKKHVFLDNSNHMEFQKSIRIVT
jgi:hypothetical protein